MRILVYGLNYFPEWIGVAKYTTDWVRWLRENQQEVRVITGMPYYPDWKIQEGYSSFYYQRCILDGVVIQRCPIWVPKKPTGFTRILHLLSFACTSLPILLVQVWCWKPDWIFVVVPTFFCAPLAWFSSLFSKTKLWLHAQDLELDAAFEMGIIRSHKLKFFGLFCERKILSQFHVVSAVSSKMLEKIAQKNIPQESLVYFPNWTDTDKIYPCDKPMYSTFFPASHFSVGTKIVLYSGNMGYKQGFENVIHTARLLEKRKDIVFILCGNGAMAHTLRKQAVNAKNILFLPLQPPEKMNELLNLADIHLIPQIASAEDLVMPSKLLDILAVGGIVIATASPTSELGKCVVLAKGMLAIPNSAEDLAKKIQMVADSKERKEHSKWIRQYAIERWSRQVILSKVWQQCCTSKNE